MSKPTSRIGCRARLVAVALSMALPAGFALTTLSGTSASSAAEVLSQTFTFNDTTQYFTVPAGVSSVDLTASGGSGGSGTSAGPGAQITETVAVSPGDTLVVELGGQGGDGGVQGPVSQSPEGGSGGLSSGDGMNGGAGGSTNYLVDGDAGAGGGGGTEVVDATTGAILVVAGGGGGYGGPSQNQSAGGGGGAVDSLFPSTGGNGYSNYGSGGAGGLGAATGVPAGASGGTPMTGALSGGGGGGGGGYDGPGGTGGGNGGAGGGWAAYEGGGGGGGGGDSYIPSGATGVVEGDNRSGDGEVTVAWTAPKVSTTTSLSVSPGSVTVGQSYTLSATVTGGGPVPPTGAVHFASAGAATVVGTLSGGTPDVATATVVAAKSVGLVTWQAEYQGDAGSSGAPGDAPSDSSAVGVSVNVAETSTTLTLSKDPLTAGQTYTATATVTGTGPTPPTGTVDFFSTGNPTLTGTLSGGTPDVVTVTSTAPIAPGTIAWAAQYEGDAGNAGSLAPTVEVAVKAPGLKPSLTGDSPSTGSAGTKVTLSGKNLGGTTKVLFGTKAAKVFSCISATACSAVAPKGVSGKVDLQVITPKGTSSANPSVTFTFGGNP